MYLTNEQTDEIAIFGQLQPDWRRATQAEINIYLLAQAKTVKLRELQADLEIFGEAGFLYSGDTFDLTDKGALNLGVKRGTSSGSTYKFQFCDIKNVRIDFGNQSAYDTFSEALSDERDRIMNVYIDYKAQIAACADVAAVDAIVIDFEA